jgi:hypothetical protein
VACLLQENKRQSYEGSSIPLGVLPRTCLKVNTVVSKNTFSHLCPAIATAVTRPSARTSWHTAPRRALPYQHVRRRQLPGACCKGKDHDMSVCAGERIPKPGPLVHQCHTKDSTSPAVAPLGWIRSLCAVIGLRPRGFSSESLSREVTAAWAHAARSRNPHRAINRCIKLSHCCAATGHGPPRSATTMRLQRQLFTGAKGECGAGPS